MRWPWKRLIGRDDLVTGSALVCMHLCRMIRDMLTILKFISLVQSILVSADVPSGFGRTRVALSDAKAADVLKVGISISHSSSAIQS